MSSGVTAVSEFGVDVLDGLSRREGKRLTPKYFYDDLGSALFEAITLLPEYGLTRADERLLAKHSAEIAHRTGRLGIVAELGSGSGKKALHVLTAQRCLNPGLLYQPIDVSSSALDFCQKEIGDLCRVSAVCSDWMAGLEKISRARTPGEPMLLLFLGSSVGNLEREDLPAFFRSVENKLRPGDYLLLGADLVKDIDVMLRAYDDPTGVTAAFNLNLLGRINREFNADFDLSAFAHEVRWNSEKRRIEMHLLSRTDQKVRARALESIFSFRAGETIWTESSHKFDERELRRLSVDSGFLTISSWIDKQWPLAEMLWQVTPAIA